MNKVKLSIWGRKLELKVVYDCYPGEEVTELQIESFDVFVKNVQIVNDSLPALVKYCLKDEQMSGEKEISNIFRIVMPQSIYVKRTKKGHKVALLCDYKLDIEHGLALIFENERLKEIGEQGII